MPDCLKSGITRPCRYEPTIQRTYLDWARHHGTAVVPARPYKPRDKAKVEVGVQTPSCREQGWRSARGLQRVGEKHGPERAERACAWGLHFNARSYKPVARLLELGRETMPLPNEITVPAAVIVHQNVRGPEYFH